jgi:peptide-methionine (R)-S-oxide reductase
MIDRRMLLASGAALVAFAGWRGFWPRANASEKAATSFEVTKSPEEWRKTLSKAQYHVLREEGTEPPGSSPLLAEHRKGTFVCAGCALPLFASETKFESGTGWPSFYQPLANAVGESRDSKFGMTRTESHCRRCGGHLGHVFEDGPKPTGLRYCMNGLSLAFVPAPASAT